MKCPNCTHTYCAHDWCPIYKRKNTQKLLDRVIDEAEGWSDEANNIAIDYKNKDTVVIRISELKEIIQKAKEGEL